jgi:hypothetical protein
VRRLVRKRRDDEKGRVGDERKGRRRGDEGKGRTLVIIRLLLETCAGVVFGDVEDRQGVAAKAPTREGEGDVREARSQWGQGRSRWAAYRVMARAEDGLAVSMTAEDEAVRFGTVIEEVDMVLAAKRGEMGDRRCRLRRGAKEETKGKRMVTTAFWRVACALYDEWWA